MAHKAPGTIPTYDHNPGTGPTLLFLHYWGGSSRTWVPVLTRLPGRDTVTIDFRGWSRSNALPGPFTLDQLANDTLKIVEDAGLDDYVIVGHSMGGKVAQLVAASHPAGLRGLVLVAPGPAKPAAEITPEYRLDLSHAYDTDESIAGARDHILTATQLSDEAKAQVLEDSRAGARGASTEWPLQGIAEDVSEYTRRIDIPVHVIAGENDVVEPTAVLKSNLVPYLSRAEFTVIPKTGHLIPLEAPDDLARAITEFTAVL